MPSPRPRRADPQGLRAGALIEQLCVARCWSAGDLAFATRQVARERRDARFEVSRRTIERVVNDGMIPRARVKGAIALALGVAPWDIWGGPAPELAAVTPAGDGRRGPDRRGADRRAEGFKYRRPVAA